MAAAYKTVRNLRRILDRISRANKLRADEAEAEFDAAAREVRTLPREGVVEAIDEAVGRSKSRKAASIYVLAELTDVPEAVERIACELSNPDWRQRDWLLQTIGLHGLRQLAPLLNEVMLEDPNEYCRRSAIYAAGVLRQDVNFPVIMQLADEGYPGLCRVLTEYNREEGRAYLRRVFEEPLGRPPTLAEYSDVNSPESLQKVHDWSSNKSDKVHAAWGLAKLGDREAIEYLGNMLYDPVITLPNVTEPGESLRAAQAIAGVFGLPFEWNTGNIPAIRAWWETNKDRLIR